MKTHTNQRTALASGATVRVAALAVVLAGYAGLAHAQAVPPASSTGTAEIGPGVVSDGSYKAGEYNGLQNSGAFAIGNFDWRSRPNFNTDSTVRWRLKGTDLGLDTRNISADVGAQGKYRLVLVYDELRRNRSDTFQTPLIGAGTNALTLPSGWLVPVIAGSSGSNNATTLTSGRGLIPSVGGANYIDVATNSPTMGALLTPTALQSSLVNAAAAADVSLFNNVDLYTKRRRFDATFLYRFDPQWNVNASFRPEHKEGLKPMGTVSRNTGGDISTIIPDRIDQNHNRATADLNYQSPRSFVQAGYFGSYFSNSVPSMSWQNWATGPSGGAPGVTNTISSAPGNQFNQVNASGGFTFSPNTKFVAAGSYGRGTQNDPFIVNVTTPVVPVSSLNGLVVTTTANARLTLRPAKKLNLSLAYRYDNRDNQTAVHIFQYTDAEEPATVNPSFPAGPTNPLGAVVAQNANANRPYSRRLNQANGDALFTLAKGEFLDAGYEFQDIFRDCPGSWISCADAATTRENRVRGEWHGRLGPNANARISETYAVRRTPDYNENAFLALVPYAAVSPVSATGGATALSFMTGNGWTGWGPAAGYTATTGNMSVFFPSNNVLANAMYANNNRISELPGMRRYYVADRDRNTVNGLLNVQAGDALSFQGGGSINSDNYPGAVYGLQDGRLWSLNAEADYALTEDVSANFYYTYESQHATTAGNTYTANSNAAAITNGQPGVVGLSGNAACDSYTTLQQRNNNNKLDPCLNWSAGMQDHVNTVGVGLRKKPGDEGHLDLVGSVIYSRSRWDNNVGGGNWANNLLNGPGAAPTTIAAYYIPAAPLPTVTTDTTEVRLTGTYSVRASGSIRLTYAYMRMRSADPMYDGMQIGSLNSVIATNEQPFNYSVNAIGISYVVGF